MNIQLNPEQFLAVYSSLLTNASIEAKEIKSKMDSVLLDALSTIDDSTNQNKFAHWMKKEKEKVTALNDELQTIKNSTVNFSQPDDGLYTRQEA